MNVSFTSIQNVAVVPISDIHFNPKQKLIMQFANLSKKQLAKHNELFKNFKDPLKKNFVTVENFYDDRRNIYFFVNGKPLDINRKNLALIEEITTNMKKILNRKTWFKKDPEYIASQDCAKNIFEEMIPKREFEDNQFIDECHDIKTVKKETYHLFETLQKRMAEYFESDYQKVKLKPFNEFG